MLRITGSRIARGLRGHPASSPLRPGLPPSQRTCAPLATWLPHLHALGVRAMILLALCPSTFLPYDLKGTDLSQQLAKPCQHWRISLRRSQHPGRQRRENPGVGDAGIEPWDEALPAACIVNRLFRSREHLSELRLQTRRVLNTAHAFFPVTPYPPGSRCIFL